jgi:hypothetical protein
MSTPDVRVRLTPEGVAEVVAALKKVQAESANANRASAKGVGVITQSLRELKGLIPTIGFAAVVGGFLALTKRALESADATGKLQQKVGGTTEELSGLTLAFRQNNSSQEELAGLLRQTTLRMDELRTGSSQVPEELSRIGITVADIKGLDAPRVFELIAQRLSNIADPATRAALATGIFKKNASDLIPALNAVGTQGIDKLTERAKQLGVVISSEFADAAAKANDALGDIKLQAEGVATQFAAGLAPQVSAAMQEFSQAMEGDGLNKMQAFGRATGIIIRSIIFAFTSLGKIVGATFAAIGAQISGYVDAVKAAARLDFSGTVDAVQRAIRETNQIRRDLLADLAQDFEDIATPPAPKEPALGRRSTTSGVTPEDKRITDARTAFLKSQLDNELALVKASLEAREDANTQAYQQGLISLQEYFRRRQEIAKQAADAEIAALKAQRAALVASDLSEIRKLTQQRDDIRRQAIGGSTSAAGASGSDGGARASNLDADLQARRLKLREQLDDLDTKIQVRTLEFQRTSAALTAEEAQAKRELANEEAAALNTLSELEGRRHEAFMRNLDLEIEERKRLFTRAGRSEEFQSSDEARVRRARTAEFEFEEVSRRGKAALDSFNRDADQIRRDQEAGIITQLEGEARLIELERQRLEVLKALAAEALKAAKATGDPARIEEAQRYADSVAEIESSFRGATDAVAKFRQGFSEGLQTGLQDFFENIDEVRSLEDAWRSLGDTILSTLRRVAAEILSKQITRGIESIFDSLAQASAQARSSSGSEQGSGGNWLSTVGSIVGALFGSGARGGGLQGYAEGGTADAAGGGLTRGPGTGQSDSIPAIIGGRRLVRIANREFIVRNPVVEQPGALSFLEAFNRHGMAALRVPRFASGGLMSTAVAAAPTATERGTRGERPLIGKLTIQAPTQEAGRRTAKQAGAEFARALRRSETSNN